MDKVDYKLLLQKYIAHVIGCEGVSFIETSSIFITAEETKELERMEKDIKENLLWQV